MQLSDLTALRVRLLRAAQRGYAIARPEHYAKLLGGSGDETSTEELLSLCEATLSGKPAPKSAPRALKPVAKPAVPPPEPEELEEGAEEAPPYAEWLKADLMAEAEARGLDAKSSMTKAELAELLEADDD